MPLRYDSAPTDPSAFKRAVAAVERHRKNVRGAIGVALCTRLGLEFDLVALLQHSDALIAQVPYIGTALLAYLLVIMWMSKNAGDRLGFGMALGLGVIEPAYLLVVTSMQSPFDVRTAWVPVTVALAHLPIAIFALRSASVYPEQDDKGPWILGFLLALMFLAVPWLAPPIIELIGG